ncbi:unnamed protein product [Meloidogyne enterolobii]|uniref:Uncharacterized protein n=2 Tax=Meloidogyne enterolobii TaxID=390850 RepID=A0A6V7UWF1_MELEN|nr:unnamed protein product [Meloidogyne enterolobii]
MDEYGIEELYNGVINDVINQVRPAFSDDGVDIEILRHLKKAWEERLQTANEWSGCSASESKSHTGTEISQLDGGGPTMDDSSSEEEEVVESTETKEHLKETDANKSSGDEEEPPLNSDDDGEDENAETIFETDNIVRTRKMWKFHLKEGIMTIRGKEFCFRRCNGDAEW